MPSAASQSTAERVKAVADFVARFPTKKAAAEALGVLPSQISHALSEERATNGRLDAVEKAIDQWTLRQLTRQGDGAEGDAPSPMEGGAGTAALVATPPAAAERVHTYRLDLTDRIPVPVVEVAGGPNGCLPIEKHTLYHDYLTREEFVMTFGHPPPLDPNAPHRWCLGLLRGESMIPRYEDGERVPIELFLPPVEDVPGGDVYLVRLDGHLYLKVVDRLPANRKQKLPARHILISYHPTYQPVEVPVGEGMDFLVLGRVVESSKQRQYGMLIGRYLQL